MENAVEALKMAFSVFFFIIGLSIVFYMFAMVREVSDIVLEKTDNTYLMEYIEPENEVSERIVGIETVIPTLYRYTKEHYIVDIVEGAEITQKFDEEVERAIYRRNIGKAYKKTYDKLYPDRAQWMANPDIDAPIRVTAYITGSIDNKALIVNGSTLSDYKNSNNLKKLKDKTFIESFELKTNGEKKFVDKDDGSVIYFIRGTEKNHLTYTVQ